VFDCTVTDFSGEDKASGVKFCTVVHGRHGQEVSNFGKLSSPEAPNKTNRRAAAGIADRRQSRALTESARGTPGHALGMCGYTVVPEDGRSFSSSYYYHY